MNAIVWYLRGKKVLCREQLYSLTRARGSLNPPAGCFLVFPIKMSEARCQTGYERQKEKHKGIMGKTETLMGRKRFGPVWCYCSSTWTKN